MSKMIKCVFLLCFFMCFPVLGQAVENMPQPSLKGNILYLNSYHDGYSWSDSILQGLRTSLDPYRNVALQVEYMDFKKYELDFVSPMLRDLYKGKFKDRNFDAVILSDNNAVDFYLSYGEELFPDVPAVFCGLNDYDPALIQGRNMTGIAENFDVVFTLSLALQINPKRNHMVIIGDESTTGVAIRNQILAGVPELNKKLSVEYWSDFTMQELRKKVQRQSEETFYFFIPFYKEIQGRFYSAKDVLEIVADETSAPIYSSWEFLLGHGIVGGRMLSGERTGEAAGKLALKVLTGVPVREIPVVQSVPTEYMFDFKELKRLHIDEKLLPSDSIIINAPKAFYEIDRGVFWTIIVGFLLLMLITLFLVRNVARRRVAEMEMGNQLSFQEILMDTIPLLVTWKDRNQFYLGANKNFANFFGLSSPSQVIGRKDSALPGLRGFLEWGEPLDKKVFETEIPIRRQRCTVKSASGEVRILEVNKVPLLDEKGKIMGTLSTGEDVTKEANLEKQLLQSQKMEAIGTLAGGIAHDFNNILTSIINSTELAQLDVDSSTPAGQDLQRVLKAAMRGSELVKKILTFSRPSQEGFQYIHVEEVVRDAVGLLKASLPRNITVLTRFGEGLGPCLADPTQIHQVVMNLCTNAFHVLRENGGRLVISLEVENIDVEKSELHNLPLGRYIALTVADNGPGIRPEIVDKIFDPFFTTKGKAEGTGLGLAVVMGIVKNHKGGIEVVSTPGLRTAFTIRLPVALGQEQEQVKSVGPALPGHGRILFVEDDEDQLATIPRVLSQLGYEVDSAKDALTAEQILEQSTEAYDLVITDYDMPGMNGVQFAKELLRHRPELPVILVSGRERVVGAAKALENISRVIIKPYDRNLLSQAIRDILHGNA
ncbi:PAS domain S-box-containing protein [Desulfobaculum bizertense DSM 18034]|uniref:histidine kinase n=2 Tax=Desulfobaculum TaxID=1433996 RepID=A0A1T4VHJ9_9BACT|nr:PAS domain S-box-containing protein [Desulfobaculum bizertense DSM 18034]